MKERFPAEHAKRHIIYVLDKSALYYWSRVGEAAATVAPRFIVGGVRQKHQEVIVWTAQKLECPRLAGA